VRRIHSTPFSTAHVPAGGRPRPSARRGNCKSSSTTADSASVTSPRARIRAFAGSPALPPLCRHRPENTSEIRSQVFIGQVLDCNREQDEFQSSCLARVLSLGDAHPYSAPFALRRTYSFSPLTTASFMGTFATMSNCDHCKRRYALSARQLLGNQTSPICPQLCAAFSHTCKVAHPALHKMGFRYRSHNSHQEPSGVVRRRSLPAVANNPVPDALEHQDGTGL